jgi:ELWxxDGT repeat protein
VFYSGSNSLTNKNELWRVAANGSGNIMLTDKLADNNNYRFIVKVVNNKAYFTAADENGTELWVSNGTVAGTRMVKDIFSGTNSANPYSLYAYNNNIFFGADDGLGPALWRSNGTDAVKIKNIIPYGLNIFNTDYNDFFCVVNNVLYLNASTADKGSELWKTNGTTAGTVLVKDISPGTENGDPAFLTNVNGTLFFSFYNYQLWKSDGTPTGTVIVKNNIYSPDYYLFTERCVADGKLFFNTGHLLWVSDGTDAGTHQVADNGLNGVISVKNLVAAGNVVFFNGSTDKFNAELYAGDATKITSLVSTAVRQVQPQSFSAVVLQNPIVSQLKLQVQSSAVQSLIITVSNTNGNIIAQKTVDAVKGSNQFTLDASNFQTGIHAIKISNTRGEIISLKVLK